MWKYIREGEVEREEQRVEIQAPIVERCLTLGALAEAFPSCRYRDIWRSQVCTLYRALVCEHFKLLWGALFVSPELCWCSPSGAAGSEGCLRPGKVLHPRSRAPGGGRLTSGKRSSCLTSFISSPSFSQRGKRGEKFHLALLIQWSKEVEFIRKKLFTAQL